MMIRVTVASIGGNFATLYLETDWKLVKVKELIESQLNIPKTLQIISLNGRIISASDDAVISTLGIDSNDLLLAVAVADPSNTSPSNSRQNNATPTNTPVHIRANILDNARNLILKWRGNPEAMRLLEDRDLAAAISTGDENAVADVLEKKHQNYVQSEIEAMEKIRSAALNPLTPESQAIIEKYMHKNRIQESLLNSQEYFTESYNNISMLYINVEINKVKISAFVDTGAQKTLISKRCAEVCNISNLIDRRFGGIVHGIGLSKMLGKIHILEMKVNDTFYPISCVVVDNSSVDFLLGLDTMRLYQCNINLPDNSFTIQGNKVSFTDSPILINNSSSFSTFNATNERNATLGANATNVANNEKATNEKFLTRDTATNEKATNEKKIENVKLDNEKEEKISTLSGVLGIGRIQALQLLESSNWDVEQAAALSLSLNDL